jgi:DNA polymerase-3 subunit delta'
LVAEIHHPDLLWVEPEGGYLKIDQVRALTRQLTLSPVEGPWQIAVLDRFELATAGAANALLKTLEEPPANVIIILLAHEAEALLPTITSRCQVLALRPVPRRVIETTLIQRWQVDSDLAARLSHLAAGRLGWAVSAAATPVVLEERVRALDDLVKLLHSQRAERFAYADVLARQQTGEVLERLDLWSSWWRDLLQLVTGSPVPLTNRDRTEQLVHLADQSDLNSVQRALDALRATGTQLLQNANARLALEVLFLDLPFFAQ